ncbi:hypothetical protein vBVpaMR16F_111 [Vibrio phage vB_VpaM_R16F]|nr:hypothetical protein vBVpaMR16F_111 [Vibrio phage vB_VpaM_R16F]
MEIDVKIDNSLVKELEKDLEYLDSVTVEYGYFEGDLHQSSGYTTPEIARWNNDGVKAKDGSIHIPSRPFLDNAHIITGNDIPEFNAIMQDSLIFGGKRQIQVGLKIVGDKTADNIRESIDMQNFAPLSPSTIVKKGNDVILIEDWELYEKGSYRLIRN